MSADMCTDSSKNSLTRRNFLTAAAAAGGIAAVVGAAAGTASADEASTGTAGAAESWRRYPWLEEPPVIDESQIAKTVEAEIVVVGGGNAGLMCACAAAENGANVAVVEAQAPDTIYYWGLHDIANVNSQYCLDHGIPEIKPSEYIAEHQRRSINRTDPRLVKKFVDHSGEMVDWLLANAPREVVDDIWLFDFPMHEEYFELGSEVSGYKCWQGTIQFNFNAAASSFIEKAESEGAKWYWEHEAKVLVTEGYDAQVKKETLDENGRATFVDVVEPRTKVTGVIAEDAEGNYVKFVASKAVVLCCGDYGGNKVMLEALQDELRLLYQAHGWDASDISGVGRNGYGIKMGLWAGGSIDPAPHTQVFPSGTSGSTDYASNVLTWGGSFNGAMTWNNPFVWMNAKGKRFTDENFMGAFGQITRAQRFKPGRFYCFFDNHWSTLISRQEPEHYDEMTTAPSQTFEGYAEVLQQWVDAGPDGLYPGDGGTTCAWAAQTLDELFEYMGFDDELKASVKAEIERYNEFCAKGEDDDFGRDPNLLLPIDEPPFYGMYSVYEKSGAAPVVLNGLNIDSDQHVLDENFEPIEGLYASGNNSGGRFAVQYSTEQQGLTLGMALTHGRVLGQELAAL